MRGRFSEDLAWGNGGVAVVLVPGALCGIGRRGQLYMFDTRDGTPLTTSAPIADASLGIAHAAAAGDQVLYGFNRGGYRLQRIRVSPYSLRLWYGTKRCSPSSSRSALEVSEHRSRGERALADRGGNARVRTRHHVARGKHSDARRLQVRVDDDRAGAVELELTSNEIGARDARDLHDEASRLHASPFSVGMPNEVHGLEAVATLQGFQLPSGGVLDARLLANLLDDVVARRECIRAMHQGHLRARRASSSASRVPLSPPPITTTSRPTK